MDTDDSLALFQDIGESKPLHGRVTMDDWKGGSSIEQQAIAMVRQFGLMSMDEGHLLPPPDIEEPLPTML